MPRVWDGERMRDGLISGTYDDNEDPPVCPAAASIPHGDFVRPAGDYLAKDSPDALFHDDAIDVATEQTREEFCRLARLVIMRHVFAGRARLLDAWQANEQRYTAACPNDTGIVTSLFLTAL